MPKKIIFTFYLYFFILIIGLNFFISTIVFAQNTPDKILENRINFLNSNEQQKTRQNWLNLIKELETEADKEKMATKAAKIRFFAADLSLKSGKKFKQKEDFNKAIKLANLMLQKCPQCPDAAGAQLIIAQSHSELNDYIKANVEIEKLKKNYPKSIKINEAQQLLSEINTKKIPQPPNARKDKRPQIYYVELQEKNQNTIITAYFDTQSKYLHNVLKTQDQTYRIYIDFTNSILLPKVNEKLNKKTNFINLSKINQHSPKDVRLVIDVKKNEPYEIVSLNNPPRIQITIKQGKNAKSSNKTIKQVTNNATVIKSHNNSTSLSRQLGLKVSNIVIDPGHGGKDTGTLKGSIKEKDIVLELSKLVQQKLQNKTKANIHLTRTADIFLTLERRTKIAKNKKADLFISIHINAHESEKINGLETYTLNLATDKNAIAVASRENSYSAKTISEMPEIIKQIMQNNKKTESKILASKVHQATLKQIGNKYTLKNLGLKEAPFFVLLKTEIPAILIEVGFITNKSDRENLTNNNYLDLLAEGIAHGIINYCQEL